jgi:hypothetical protein
VTVGTGWPPESPPRRPTTGRQTLPVVPPRSPHEYPAAKPTGDIAPAPSLAEETSQVAALIDAALKQLAPRMNIRAEYEDRAALSAQLTTAKSITRRYKVATAFLGAIVAGAGAMTTTCLATWQQAKDAAVEPAQEAKATARSLAAEVEESRTRIDAIEGTLDGMERDLGVQGRKLDRVLDALENGSEHRR